MRPRTIIALGSLLCSLMLVTANAQTIEDALRPALPINQIGTRAAGMGNAFTGVADDYSALYWNPAGLGQLRSNEFSLALGNNRISNTSTFLSNNLKAHNSNTVLNSIGVALPFQVVRGSFVLAVGYNRLTDYTHTFGFEGFNTQSSILPSLYDEDVNFDLPWQLGLEDTTGAIPIQNRVQQEGTVLESGGLNQWAFGGSMEIGRNLWLGLGFNFLTGSYSWERTITETDPQNAHQGTIAGIISDRSDFQSVKINQNLDQDISGWNAKIGIFYSFEDKARFGITVKTPTLVTIEETYSIDAKAFFADAVEQASGPDFATGQPMLSSYDIITPWVFTLGASFSPVSFILLSGDIDLTDYTQTEFNVSDRMDSRYTYFRDLNADMKSKVLQPTNNFRLGMEITVPQTGLSIRGGFGENFSPYKNDPAEYNTVMYSAGLGYLFENTFQLNLGAVMSTRKSFQFNYNDPNISVPDEALKVYEDVSATRIFLSLSYKF